MSADFFVHGIEFSLPHPKIPRRTILLLCIVIKRAWELLHEHPPKNFHLHSAKEDRITQELVDIIENYLRKYGEVRGFNSALFGRVTRAPKITNFDKTHPDKMPDILFDLKRDKLPILSGQDGLFVECKPIDHKHTILSDYCNEGLMRFINGDYAWAMQNAMMVGYVGDGYSFQNLKSVIDDIKKGAHLKTTGHFSVDKDSVYSSSHNRDFKWPEGFGHACPISIAHLWLLL